MRAQVALKTELLVVHAVDRKTEELVHRHRVAEIETRLDLETGLALRIRRLREVHVFLVERHHRAILELRAGQLKGALADQVHGATDGTRGHVRRRRFRDLDPRNVVDREIADVDRAGVLNARAIRQVVAIDHHGRHASGQPADRNAPAIEHHARHVFDELTDVAVHTVAKRIRCRDGLQIHCEALLVDRDRPRVPLTRLGHHERLKRHRALVIEGHCAAGDRQIAPHGLARQDVDLERVLAGARVENLQRDRAWRNVRQRVGAEGVGERLQRRAGNLDPDIAHVGLGAGVEDPALDGGSFDRTAVGHGAEREPASEGGEQGAEGFHGFCWWFGLRIGNRSDLPLAWRGFGFALAADDEGAGGGVLLGFEGRAGEHALERFARREFAAHRVRRLAAHFVGDKDERAAGGRGELPQRRRGVAAGEVKAPLRLDRRRAEGRDRHQHAARGEQGGGGRKRRGETEQSH